MRSSIKAAIKELWVHRWPSLRGSEAGPNTCWHPLFGGADKLFQVSQYVGVLGHSEDTTCQSRALQTQEDLNPVLDYVLSTVTGERSFVVTNGRLRSCVCHPVTIVMRSILCLIILITGPLAELLHGRVWSVLWSRKSNRSVISRL